MSRGGNIIDMLHDCEVSQFGKIHESSVNEDQWKTMHGAHILVDDKNNIKAGGPESLRKSDSNSKNSVSKSSVKVPEYTGKRSGNKNLDDQFDTVRQAQAEHHEAVNNAQKVRKDICRKLEKQYYDEEIKKLDPNQRGSKAKAKQLAHKRADKEALNSKEYKAARKESDKAVSKFASETIKLKKLYNDYRKSGGEQIRDYYIASTEWDDYD